MPRVPSIHATGIESRLTHPVTGINHDNPDFETTVRLRYRDGEWHVLHRIDWTGYTHDRETDIPREIVCQLSEIAGFIHPDVADSNRRGWLEAYEGAVRKARMIATREHEEKLLAVRKRLGRKHG